MLLDAHVLLLQLDVLPAACPSAHVVGHRLWAIAIDADLLLNVMLIMLGDYIARLIILVKFMHHLT